LLAQYRRALLDHGRRSSSKSDAASRWLSSARIAPSELLSIFSQYSIWPTVKKALIYRHDAHHVVGSTQQADTPDVGGPTNYILSKVGVLLRGIPASLAMRRCLWSDRVVMRKHINCGQERGSIGRTDARQNVAYLRRELTSADSQLMGDRGVLHILPQPL
jgi:hypothetical protein